MPSMQDVVGAVRDAPLDELPQLVGFLAHAQALALARIAAAQSDTPPPAARNLTAREAAKLLGVSASWLHKNARELPFTRRIGRRVLFDSAGLERWRRSRT